jgi:hypothetical protein
MEQQKKNMIDALTLSLGIVSTACQKAGIGRTTHYRWLKEDEEYAEEVRQVNDRTLDFAETHLHKLIKDGNPAATIFFLKTRGKSRGYVERQEIEVAEKKPLSWFGDDNTTVS